MGGCRPLVYSTAGQLFLRWWTAEVCPPLTNPSLPSAQHGHVVSSAQTAAVVNWRGAGSHGTAKGRRSRLAGGWRHVYLACRRRRQPGRDTAPDHSLAVGCQARLGDCPLPPEQRDIKSIAVLGTRPRRIITMQGWPRAGGQLLATSHPHTAETKEKEKGNTFCRNTSPTSTEGRWRPAERLFLMAPSLISWRAGAVWQAAALRLNTDTRAIPLLQDTNRQTQTCTGSILMLYKLDT